MGQNMENCVVTDLKVHSKDNCFILSPDQIQRLQNEVSVSTVLEPGTNLVKIKSGAFSYQGADGRGEPSVLLWIYGGSVINQKTNVLVSTTWVSLNGYDDVLTLDVRAAATLCAFFLDTHRDDNDGELYLSVVRI
jgi:hypothetical protein